MSLIMRIKLTQAEVMQTREQLVSQVKEEFKLQYGHEPNSVTLTPGRINIIGEHTDYNDGLAMPVAIDRWVCAAISKSSKESSTIYSLNYKQSVSTSPHGSVEIQASWKQLAATAIYILKTEFGIEECANMAVGGNIPIGCGLSSSAAYVISITQTFCRIFSIQIGERELAYLCQKIENEALGITCGLLDQYGIILSKKDHIMLIDFQDDSIEYIPVSLNECSWIVINSQIQRELSESLYIQRVNECRAGLEILKKKFNISTIRGIDTAMLQELKTKHRILYKRLSHVIDENCRVQEMTDPLERGMADKIGTILKESHESLSSLYEVSCKEIDYIIKLSEDFDGWYGGRIIGGGFGGCSIHLVAHRVIEDYRSYITANYTKKYDIIPDILEVTFSGGLQHL